MKNILSPAEKQAWADIVGPNERGATSAMIENLPINIMDRFPNLKPALVSYGVNPYKIFDIQEFRSNPPTRQSDGWCRLFYAPLECGKETETSSDIWLQWVGALLGYGRKDHRWAPKLRVPDLYVEDFRNRGILIGNRTITRFLSLEAVLWYFAVQTNTWEYRRAQVQGIKDSLRRQLPKATILDTAPPKKSEEIDVDKAFASTTDPRIHVPAAGAKLTQYQPHTEPFPGANAMRETVQQMKVDRAPVVTKVDTAPVVTKVDTAPVKTSLEDLLQSLENIKEQIRERKREAAADAFEAGEILPMGEPDEDGVFNKITVYMTTNVGAEVRVVYERIT